MQLWLSHNSVGPRGFLALAAALTAGATPALAELDLARNAGVGDEGGIPLARALASGCVPALRTLRLEGCTLAAGAARELAAALPALPLLETLALGANQLTERGAAAIVGSLGAHAPALCTLDLRCVRRGGALHLWVCSVMASCSHNHDAPLPPLFRLGQREWLARQRSHVSST